MDRCRCCDGQGLVIWRDGVAMPAYAWNAEEDTETCPSCKGSGQQAVITNPTVDRV
jgi:DnaJ-class molecular chaperone